MTATMNIYRWTGSGSGVTMTSITGAATRANASDSPTAGTDNPIQIPTSGGGIGGTGNNSNYSYWVSTRLQCDASPTGQVNNVRWYVSWADITAPSFGNNINLWVAQAISYVPATGAIGQTGIPLTNNAYGSMLVHLPVPGAVWSGLSTPTSWFYNTLPLSDTICNPLVNLSQYTANDPMLVFSGATTLPGNPSPGGVQATVYGMQSTMAATPLPATAFCNLVVYQIEVTSNATAGATNQVTFVWKYDET